MNTIINIIINLVCLACSEDVVGIFMLDINVKTVNKTIKQFYKEEFKAYPWLGNAWIVIYADSEGKYIRYAGKLKDMNNNILMQRFNRVKIATADVYDLTKMDYVSFEYFKRNFRETDTTRFQLKIYLGG